MSASSAPLSAPEGPGSVSGAPNLPVGFTDTFTSHYIDTDQLRQHAVIGGQGPPLLLVHGWPETWYAWRLVMPALAADHPDRVERLALAEVPGPPGAIPAPPLFIPEPLNNKLWHIPFNRVNHPLTEQLVQGREDLFFGYEFAIQGGKPLPEDARSYYFRIFSDPEVLRGSFGFYRAWDSTLAQNEQRKTRPLAMPVLAIGGAASWGDAVGNAMQVLADDVESLVIPDAGHWVAEQAPEELVAALTAFLAPYRDRG